MSMRTAVLLLLLVSIAAAEDLSRDAKRLLDSATRMGKATRFRERQKELLLKKAEGVGDEDLESVVKALAGAEKSGKSQAAVLRCLREELIRRRFGPEPLEKIPDLPALLAAREPAKKELAIAKALGLLDLRLARALSVKASEDESPRVRLRAAVSLGDLLSYGVRDREVMGALAGLIGDEDAGVRAIALRRGFEVRFDPAFEWALERLDDSVKATVTVRGSPEEVRPGAEALRGLRELTWIQRELTYRKYLGLKEEEKETLKGLFRAWWNEHAGRFPVPGFREARFRRKPSATKTILLKSGAVSGTCRFWSGLDRTRVRLTVDEIRLIATSLYDWRLHFHVSYMSSGMRVDDGEGYRRNLFVGTPYVLARKACGAFVLVFQNLVDGGLRIRVAFHDPER